MNHHVLRRLLFGVLAASVLGCGGTAVESPADRIAVKKEEWRRRRASAEDRLEEIASRLSPDQRRRLRTELQREFDEGERSLEGSSLR